MRKYALAALAAGLAACASLRPAPAADAAHAQAEAAAIAAAVAQAHEQAQTRSNDYRLSGADLLEITVFGQQNLDRTVRLSQAGTITFPLVGSVRLGGLTTAAGEAALAASLSEYVRDPQVTIFVKEYGNKTVFVFGQVGKPGAVALPVETPLTVLGAVSEAGGFTRIAAPDRTRVIRQVDGRSQTFVIDVSAITKHGENDKDMILLPNDIVFVPESMF
jgi:polysaccharide export outer membrane protein